MEKPTFRLPEDEMNQDEFKQLAQNLNAPPSSAEGLDSQPEEPSAETPEAPEEHTPAA